MTEDQAKQYEICKTRRHEVDPGRTQSFYSSASAQGYEAGWLCCRWCGIHFKEIKVTKQVERA